MDSLKDKNIRDGKSEFIELHIASELSKVPFLEISQLKNRALKLWNNMSEKEQQQFSGDIKRSPQKLIKKRNNETNSNRTLISDVTSHNIDDSKNKNKADDSDVSENKTDSDVSTTCTEYDFYSYTQAEPLSPSACRQYFKRNSNHSDSSIEITDSSPITSSQDHTLFTKRSRNSYTGGEVKCVTSQYVTDMSIKSSKKDEYCYDIISSRHESNMLDTGTCGEVPAQKIPASEVTELQQSKHSVQDGQGQTSKRSGSRTELSMDLSDESYSHGDITTEDCAGEDGIFERMRCLYDFNEMGEGESELYDTDVCQVKKNVGLNETHGFLSQESCMAELDKIKSDKKKSAKVKSAKIKSDKTKVGSGKITSERAESDRIELSKAESDYKMKTDIVMSAKTELDTRKSAKKKSDIVGSGKARSGKKNSATAQSDVIKLAKMKPTKTGDDKVKLVKVLSDCKSVSNEPNLEWSASETSREEVDQISRSLISCEDKTEIIGVRCSSVSDENNNNNSLNVSQAPKLPDSEEESSSSLPYLEVEFLSVPDLEVEIQNFHVLKAESLNLPHLEVESSSLSYLEAESSSLPYLEAELPSFHDVEGESILTDNNMNCVKNEESISSLDSSEIKRQSNGSTEQLSQDVDAVAKEFEEVEFPDENIHDDTDIGCDVFVEDNMSFDDDSESDTKQDDSVSSNITEVQHTDLSNSESSEHKTRMNVARVGRARPILRPYVPVDRNWQANGTPFSIAKISASTRHNAIEVDDQRTRVHIESATFRMSIQFDINISPQFNRFRINYVQIITDCVDFGLYRDRQNNMYLHSTEYPHLIYHNHAFIPDASRSNQPFYLSQGQEKTVHGPIAAAGDTVTIPMDDTPQGSEEYTLNVRGIPVHLERVYTKIEFVTMATSLDMYNRMEVIFAVRWRSHVKVYRNRARNQLQVAIGNRPNNIVEVPMNIARGYAANNVALALGPANDTMVETWREPGGLCTVIDYGPFTPAQLLQYRRLTRRYQHRIMRLARRQ